jgi:hypothetical protein
MRQLIRFGLILGLLSNSAFGFEPVQGVYLGLLGDVSYTRPSPLVDYSPFGIFGSRVTLSPVGGGGGFSIGYRISPVRLEGELLFNINNYGELPLGTCTLVSPNVLGPQPLSLTVFGAQPAVCIEDPVLSQSGIGFDGNTSGFFGLFNIFYDFLSCDTEKRFFPYIGAGVGGGVIRNTADFKSNVFSPFLVSPVLIPYSDRVSSSTGTLAGQGIIGFGYFIDDFATLGLDFRYLGTFRTNKGTATTTTTSSSSVGIASINITATFALEKAIC